MHVDGTKLLAQAISFRNWSVNRQKYSEPEDVLVPDWPDWGIAAFRVADIPLSLESASGSRFDFRVEHVPLEENYAHSEIRTYKNGLYVENPDPPQTIKKKFRQMLSDRSTILHRPQANGPSTGTIS